MTRGRPPLPEPDRRKAFISVRITDSMRTEIDEVRRHLTDRQGNPVSFSRAVQILVRIGLEDFGDVAAEQRQ